MKQEVEKLLRKFDRDFRENPDLRIEHLDLSKAEAESSTPAERLELWRELI